MSKFITAILFFVAAVSTPVQAQQWQLEERIIDADFVFANDGFARGVPLDEELTSRFQPGSIDEFFDFETQYYLADTIAQSELGSIYLIVKDDPNEAIGWLVIYDKKMRVEHQLEVYYENAEGNYYATTVIHDNVVTITGENITPEDQPVSRFRVEGLRWKQIKE